jgi:hypothetical protein
LQRRSQEHRERSESMLPGRNALHFLQPIRPRGVGRRKRSRGKMPTVLILFPRERPQNCTAHGMFSSSCHQGRGEGICRATYRWHPSVIGRRGEACVPVPAAPSRPARWPFSPLTSRTRSLACKMKKAQSTSLVWRHQYVHRIPRPTLVTIAKRPFYRTRDAAKCH